MRRGAVVMGSAAPAPKQATGDAASAYPRLLPAAPAVARSRAKRWLDLLAGTLLALVFLPVGLVIALAIRLDSGGPVLFRQKRVGLDGETFTILKFRSMHTGCAETPHREYVTGLVRGEGESPKDGVYKLVDDDRVTRVGRWLRRTSLDELPQLLNVLRGEMSLVGPRPPLPYEVEHYDERQMRRLSAPQGITGLWQVSGRNQLSYRSMVQLDMEYIERWTLGLDLRILLRTIPVVLRNSGRAH